MLQTNSAAIDFSSSAAARAWGSSFVNTFITAGWVRQNDIGIVNWSTATIGAAGVVWAWDLIKMNDSLAGTNPCYIKFEFATYSGSAAGPGMFFTVGTGTDGYGNLTGQVGTRTLVMNVNYTFGVTPANLTRISADTNRLAYSFYCSSGTSFNFYIFVERTHNATGADTADGIVVLVGTNQGTVLTQYIPYTGTVSAGKTYTATVTPATGTGASGNTVQLYPIRVWNVGESSPFLGCFLYFNTDLTASNAITATTWDGNSHSIWPFGYSTGFPTTYGGTTVVAMRND